MNSQNQSNVAFALNHLQPFLLFNPTDWSFVDINQFHYNAFVYLLNNPNTTAAQINWMVANPEATSQLLTSWQSDQSDENREFDNWAINYLTSNPNVSWEQFQNWFLTPVEGKDGDYDAAFWEDPNLTFQQQILPSLADFKNAFPKNQNGNIITAMNKDDVYALVGGSLNTQHNTPGNNNYRNACSLRGSRALNYSGNPIPVVIQGGVQKTEKGADGKNYILNAKAFNAYMHKTFGPPTHKLTKAQINNNPQNIINFLSGKVAFIP